MSPHTLANKQAKDKDCHLDGLPHKAETDEQSLLLHVHVHVSNTL